MEHKYSFEYWGLILKPLLYTDIENLRVLRNKERQYFASQNIITCEEQIEWYQAYLAKSDDIMFKIVKKESPEKFIGAIALYNIDWKEGICEFGRTLVNKELAPEKGVGLAATKAVCLFGFECLEMKKIRGEALKTNERILKVYARAGFSVVGENEKFYFLEVVLKELLQENIY